MKKRLQKSSTITHTAAGFVLASMAFTFSFVLLPSVRASLSSGPCQPGGMYFGTPMCAGTPTDTVSAPLLPPAPTPPPPVPVTPTLPAAPPAPPACTNVCDPACPAFNPTACAPTPPPAPTIPPCHPGGMYHGTEMCNGTQNPQAVPPATPPAPPACTDVCNTTCPAYNPMACAATSSAPTIPPCHPNGMYYGTPMCRGSMASSPVPPTSPSSPAACTNVCDASCPAYNPMTCATISSFNVPHLAPVNAFGPAAGATFSAPYHAAPTVSPSYAPAHAPVFLRMQHEDAPVLLAPSGIPAPAGMHGNAPMMTEPQLTPAYYHPAADAAVPAPAVPVHVPMEVACKDVCNAACGVYSPVLCACSRDVCSDSRCPGYEPGACGVPVTETLVSILKEFMRRMFPGH